MWCMRLVNFACLSFTAACRIRLSALCTVARSCARFVFCRGSFPSARPLRSTCSAISASASGTNTPILFAGFVASTGLSDFLLPFIIAVRPWTSRCDPSVPAWVVAGSPGSRAGCFRACLGSLTSRDTNAPRQSGTLIMAFPFSLQGRHPDLSLFRGSIPSLHFPLSTLRLVDYSTRHDSGPSWLAKPLTFETFVQYNLPVYPGAQGENHEDLKDTSWGHRFDFRVRI